MLNRFFTLFFTVKTRLLNLNKLKVKGTLEMNGLSGVGADRQQDGMEYRENLFTDDTN